MNKYNLTVLMNCKNGEKYLNEALEGLRNQTYKNWNLFFFDNQSNDSSKKIFLSIEDSRFKYFSFEKNLNLGEARKTAWQFIDTDYVAICDVDDISLKNRFFEQIKYMENNKNCAVVGSNVNLINNHSRKFNEIICYMKQKELKYQIQYKHVFNSATLLFRKQCVDEVNGYNSNYEMVNDYDLLFRLSRKFDIGIINKTLVSNRQHDSNLSYTKIVKGQIELLHLQINILKKIRNLKAILLLIKNIFLTCLRVSYHYLKSFFK